MRERTSTSIILFDGVCNLCSASVQFIIRHDRSAHFSFASLESAFAKRYPESTTANSLLLVEGSKVYTRSTAVLRIARRLDGLWPLAYGFVAIPKPLRDVAYDFVAKRRYQIFGRRDTCMLPSPDVQRRFLK